MLNTEQNLRLSPEGCQAAWSGEYLTSLQSPVLLKAGMEATLVPRQGPPHTRPHPSTSTSFTSSADGEENLSSNWMVRNLQINAGLVFILALNYDLITCPLIRLCNHSRYQSTDLV